MATAPLIKPYIASHEGSDGALSMGAFKEAAGQTFIENDLISVNADGQVQKSADADGLPVVGLAKVAASGVQGTTVRCELFDQHTKICINLKHVAGGPVIQDHVLLETNLFGKYDIYTDGNGYQFLDNNSNGDATACYVIVGIHPNYAVGDTNAWVYAKPMVTRLRGVLPV